MSGLGGGNTSRESTPRPQLRTPDNTPPPAAVQGEPIPQLVKLSKSKGASILEKYYVKLGGMFFQTFEEAHNATDHAQWSPPINDPSIPRNDVQDRAIVHLLVEAFMDTDHALDTEGNAYRKRLTPGTNVFYEPWTIEACAWEILHMVKDIHTSGFSAPIYDSDILKAIGQTENWTFVERIGMICRVLKISKSVAVTLMKHEKVWTTIGAPHKLYNSTMVNAASNANRNKWVKAGREAEKGPHTTSRTPNPDGPPTKRQRPNNAPTLTLHNDVIRTPFSLAALNMKYGSDAPVSQAVPASSLSSFPSPTTSNNNDVEMVDAVTEEPTADTFTQDEPLNNIDNNDNTIINTEDVGKFVSINTTDKGKATSTNSTKPALNLKSNLSDSPNTTAVTATRAAAAADVEAAHALLGFGRAGRVA